MEAENQPLEEKNGSGGNDAEDNPDSSAAKAEEAGKNDGSPKVQFGAGTKEGDGSVTGVKRVKRSFRDLVLQDVIEQHGRQAGSPDRMTGPGRVPLQKSILKVRGDPLSAKSPEKQSLSFVNKAYEGDLGEDVSNVRDVTSGAPAGVTRSPRAANFPFLAGRGEAGKVSGTGFADVVDLLIQRSSIDLGGRDMHPFGRDCSIEGIMSASRPKSHSKNSAFGKLMVWMTVVSFLVGAAFGIILLSETYNANQKLKEEIAANSTQ